MLNSILMIRSLFLIFFAVPALIQLKFSKRAQGQVFLLEEKMTSPKNKRLVVKAKINNDDTVSLLVDTGSLITYVMADRFETEGLQPLLNGDTFNQEFAGQSMNAKVKYFLAKKLYILDSANQANQLSISNVMIGQAQPNPPSAEQNEIYESDVNIGADINGILGLSITYDKNNPLVLREYAATADYSPSWLDNVDVNPNHMTIYEADPIDEIVNHPLGFHRWVVTVTKFIVTFPGKDPMILDKEIAERGNSVEKEAAAALENAVIDSGAADITIPNVFLFTDLKAYFDVYHSGGQTTYGHITQGQNAVTNDCRPVLRILPEITIHFQSGFAGYAGNVIKKVFHKHWKSRPSNEFVAVLSPKEYVKNDPSQKCPAFLGMVNSPTWFILGLPFIQKYGTEFHWSNSPGEPDNYDRAMYVTVHDSIK